MIGARGWNNHQGRAYLYWGAQDMDVNADKIFMAETGSSVKNLGQFIWGGYVMPTPMGTFLLVPATIALTKKAGLSSTMAVRKC